MVVENLSNYKHLRDPLQWDNDNNFSATDPEQRRNAMVSHQADKMAASLIVMPAFSEKIALQNFIDLMRCMGDKASAFKGDLHEPIIKRLTISRLICDEIYMQVMKQLSSNPSVDSTTKGWELLQNMVKVALPSAEVYEFLMAFVTREATPAETEKKDDATAKAGGWKQAFLAVAKKKREEQMLEMNSAGNLNLAAVTSMAMAAEAQKDDKNKRQSMVERQLAREKRKSRVAAAEERDGDIGAKRKAFATKQVDMAAGVLNWLNGKK